MSKHARPPYRLEHEVFSGDGQEFDYIEYVIVCGDPETNAYEVARVDDEDTAKFIVRAANSYEKLVAVLIEYESIEAKIILDDKCWNTETLPQHYYDRLVELQYKRNEALESADCSLETRAKAALRAKTAKTKRGKA